MDAPKWRELTEKQRNILKSVGVINGCGGSNSKFNPPEFFFTASCHRHDYSYYLGNTLKDKLRADFGFYRAMRHDIDTNLLGYSPLKKWMNRIAIIYFLAVLLCGRKYFNWKEKKTKRDLDKIFSSYKDGKNTNYFD